MKERQTGEDWLASRQKRSMDIALSTALLPVALPLFLAALVSIKAVDGYDPRFSHERIGKDNELFTVHKLRTMSPDEIPDIASSSGFLDSRATKLGGFLRKIRLDEVPQLINIYQGDMSVVGPRPLVPNQYNEIMDSLDASGQKEWQHARSSMKPGMIDRFGISTYKNNYSELSVQNRVEQDIAYFHDASLRTDINIISNSLNLLPRTLLGSSPEHQDTHHAYRRGAFLLSSAAQAFEIDVSNEEVVRWDSLFRIVRILDDLIDEDGATDLSNIIDDAFEGVPIPLTDPELVKQYSTSMHQLDGAQYNLVRRTLILMPIFSERKKDAKSAIELANISKQEALAFSSILHLETGIDSIKRERFNRWLDNTAQAGELVDASFDLKDDYRAHLVTVEPTLRNQIILGSLSIEHLKHTLMQQSPRINYQLAKAAFACFKDR